jgi:sugar phosphate isomerase/epimerase
VEVAFIQGYVNPFDEAYFSPANARELAQLLTHKGLSCFAFSSHIDLVTEQAVDNFRRRMEFAAQIGARLIVSNAGPKREEEAFMKHIEVLARIAESLDMVIGLENPGDGKPNLLDSGQTGAALIRRIGSERVKFNYDFGNLVSHLFEKVRPEEDYKYALPVAGHLHVKDVKAHEKGGWYFTEIGKGSIDYATVLGELKSGNPGLPLSLEVPLRLARAPDASPRRSTSPVPLEEIRRILRGSLDYVKGNLSAGESNKREEESP